MKTKTKVPGMRRAIRELPRRWPLAGALLLVLPGSAFADSVTDWSAFADTVIAGAGAPPQQYRVLAMTQIAVHDALNSIDRRYRTYSPLGAASHHASPDAAVAAAAAGVLRATIPSQLSLIDAQYAAAIAALPACPASAPGCVGQGIGAGEAAAAAIVQRRQLDGSATPHLPYTLAPGPGVYQPTLPTPPPPAPYPQFGNWGNLKPFAIINNRQFAPGPAPELNLRSKAYADEYNEVKLMGSFAVRNAAPDSEESKVARYFPGGGANLNAIARAVVAGKGLDRWQHARLFALVNMAVNDALITTFGAKYRYNFWRPYTAIRWANDGNPLTQPDPGFTSYITTPPYPDYPCGLPSTMGAGVQVMRSYFGTDRLPYSLTAAGIPRSYTRLSDAESDSVDARVYGGIHFRFGCEVGVEQSRRVAKFVYLTQLRASRH
ncbi:vanadium-dependent haloperoxidase [Pseudoxanthomonas gei]|nr:vanadium-dependent haloperoxidase [Pseudoxanthomonas gei]